MKWFNKENSGDKGTPTTTPGVEVGNGPRATGHEPRYCPVRPYEACGRGTRGVSFGRLLFIIAAFVIGIFVVRAGYVQSELITLTQGDWTTEKAASNAALPVDGWEEYSVKDSGVVAGEDLHLESAGNIITQTSGDGAADTCDTPNCSTGGGFNAVTAVKIGTTIVGPGADANIQLATLPIPPNEFTLDLLGSYDTNSAFGTFISGNTAAIADGNNGLILVDISTPSAPALIGALGTSGKAVNVFIDGNTAYVAGHTAGLHIINITAPASPSLTGTYNTSGKAYDVAVSGNYAYVADHSGGLKVIDTSVPASPSLAGTYATPGNALGVVVAGNTAYVAEDGTGLAVLNVTTPSNPALIGSFATAAPATGGIFVSGSTAYMTIGASGIQIIDITTPSSPSSIGAFDTGGTAKDIAVSGNIAYVAIDTSGVAAVDISAPSAPSLLGAYDTPGIAGGIVVVDDDIYVADTSAGLQIIRSGQSGGSYFAFGSFESAVMNLGSGAYKFDAVISDVTVPAAALPVGTEIPSTDPGLIALWRMNTSNSGDTTAADFVGSSAGTLHAASSGTNTSTSAMWDGSGHLGSSSYTALEFDGTDDYVSAGYVGTGVKTVMFWVNHADPALGDELLELNGGQSIAIAQTTGNITATGFQSPTIYVDGSPASAALSPGWHHVAVVTGTGIVASDVNLGRVNTGRLNGLLDEVALYDYELSANDITKISKGSGVKFQVAASNCPNGAKNPPNCSLNIGWGDADAPFIGSDGTSNTYLQGPMALYHLDDGTGGSVADVSGYGHDGTLVIGSGGAQATKAAAWMNGTSEALKNLGSQAISFDGTDDYIAVGDIQANIKSVEFWINRGNNVFGGVVLELNATHAVVITTSNNITATGFVSPAIYVDGSAASAKLLPGWHHVAVVTATAAAASDVNLGRVGSQYMSGSLDEVVLYDRALSAGEIKARVNNGSGKMGSAFGAIAGSALDNKQYLKFKAYMSTSSMVYGPRVNDVSFGYSAFPSGAGLVSSVFDTGDASSFLTEILWSEKLNGHDARLQVATSGDGFNWNYCGMFDCSTDDWLDFSSGVGGYYTKSSGNIPNSQSRNADNDRYIKYKVWLMSNDGETTPSLDDVTVTYDTAHLEIFAPDGVSETYTAAAGTPFNIIVRVKDSSGNILNNHDGSRTIKLKASAAQPDTETCVSSFTGNGRKELSRNVVFFSGEATIANVILCDASAAAEGDSPLSGTAPLFITAQETIGGALQSANELTVELGERTSMTLYWDPLDDCANFDHYEVWYGLLANTTLGIGLKWDENSDPAMALCSTSTTTVTNLLPDVQYYFKLFAIDNDGNAVSLDVRDSGPGDEELTGDDLMDALDANIPEGARLYDVAIKLGDNHSPDPAEDARGSYKHGDVVAVVLNGHLWTENEKASFLITQMVLTEEEAAGLLKPEVTEDGTVTKRRASKIEMGALGLTGADAKDDIKRKALRDQLKGKRLKKDTAVKEKK